uniref:Uncharacterized protein n=1 Tax=Rhizophora mucronata TaxID=61149 RepID=A0A2P2NG63_RHIMU
MGCFCARLGGNGDKAGQFSSDMAIIFAWRKSKLSMELGLHDHLVV